jgi:tetratricopeptide (TPR) repeat protein
MYKPFLNDYAYGWVVTNASFKQNDQPVPVITHNGGINGFSTNIVRFPKEKNLIVLLDNSNSEYIDRLSESIAKIIYNQPYEPPKISIVPVLDKTITEKGNEAGIAQYRDLKAKQTATYDVTEPELNRLGYQLLRNGKPKEAIEIFKLNVEAYPQGANAYDSLAEAYMTANERELAIQNYKKSLELNPNNTNAATILKRLEKPPVVVDAKLFDTYVGEYEVGPGFVLRVFREGDKFLTQATGQGVFEIFPESETVFYPRAFVAKLTFVKDADGKVTGLRIDQNGRVTLGKRIN